MTITPHKHKEQMKGFEPSLPAWQADVLTANTTSAYFGDERSACFLLPPNM